MPTPFKDVTFLARASKALTGISGADITLPASTTAEGLSKNGNITIDATGGVLRSVTVENTGAGDVVMNVVGDLNAQDIYGVTVSSGGTVIGEGHFTFDNDPGVSGGTLQGAPFTANRTFTFPDANGTVVLQDGSGDATVTRWIICDTPFMRGATGTDNMRFNTSGVSGSHAVTIPSKSGTMAVGTTAAAIADLVVGVATVDDCAAAINSILAVLRGFEQVSP